MPTDQERAWALMSKLDYCMLVTRDGQQLHGRPMSSIVKPDEGRIYFLTHAEAVKDDEITADPNILLAYGDGKSTFVATRATAEIANDRNLVRRLWSSGAQAFWPQGPDDPDIIVVVATPHAAEYWESPNAIARAVKFAVALASGTTADMGTEAKVKL